MKLIFIIILTAFLASCATSTSHCDAYGNKSGAIKP